MSDKLQGGVKAGSTSVSLTALLRKTADNTETTGKVAADMTVYYMRQGGSPTSVTASDLAAINSAWSSGGVKEADATNMPGLYRIDWPDAAFATGADWVQLSVKVASSYVYHERVPLTTNVVQTGDSYARIGAAGAGLTSVAVGVGGIDSTALTTAAVNAIADAHLDRADAIETGITVRLALRYAAAAAAGVASGMNTTTAVILGANVGTTRITATVDANGNRSAVTLS